MGGEGGHETAEGLTMNEFQMLVLEALKALLGVPGASYRGDLLKRIDGELARLRGPERDYEDSHPASRGRRETP